MSDPMTNVKIEDVLSSIRRLVAEGSHEIAARPRPGGSPAPVGRLVLTPSHRVDLDKAASPPPPPLLRLRPSDRQDAPSERDHGPATPDLLSTIAELEAAVLGQADEWEDDGTGTDLDKSWASAGFRGDVTVEDAVEVDRSDWPDTLAEAQRLYGMDDDDLDDDASDAGPAPIFRHQSGQGSATDDAGVEYNDDLMPLSDADFNAEEQAQLNLYLGGGGGITREALTQIVRDIVRDELQGQMGERVTRNVRKLVRREIHRAISTSDFD